MDCVSAVGCGINFYQLLRLSRNFIMDEGIDNEIFRRLFALLKGLRYGSVHLIVHDGKVVRMERVERIRLTGSPEALDDNSG